MNWVQHWSNAIDEHHKRCGNKCTMMFILHANLIDEMLEAGL